LSINACLAVLSHKLSLHVALYKKTEQKVLPRDLKIAAVFFIVILKYIMFIKMHLLAVSSQCFHARYMYTGKLEVLSIKALLKLMEVYN